MIEQRLNELLSHDGPQKLLFEAAKYSIFSGGKRLRPKLTLITAQIYGVPIEHAIDPACAIEMIHTYSLIHDDLPCMDDDDLRRGKPTLHKVYGEGHAVLTGDYLLTYAFEVLSQSPHLSDQQKIQLIQLLAQSAGGHGMIGGQVVDISCPNPDWLFLHQHKTAALIAAAMGFGGIIGHASPADLQLLHKAGLEMGIAFQIIDDHLDNEITLPKSDAEELYTSATTNLQQLSVPSQPLIDFCSQLIYRSV